MDGGHEAARRSDFLTRSCPPTTPHANLEIGQTTRNRSGIRRYPPPPPTGLSHSLRVRWRHMTEFVVGTSDDRLGGVWRVASMTGLRSSELCGLTWPDVDLDTGVISVRRAAVVVDGRRHLKSPKTPASRRAVELDNGTVQALREWRARQLQERLRAGEAWEDGEWVVTDELGAPVHPDWLSILFTRRAKEVGLPRITIRQLRHSHATALLRAGAHPKVVQERLGHSSIRVTLDVYSAVLPNMQREAVERLVQAFDPR